MHHEREAARRLLDAASGKEHTVEVRTEDLGALMGHLRDVANGIAPPPRIPFGEGVEHYPLAAAVWRRSPYGGCPEGDWVLELSGSINDTGLSCRHTQPASVRPEDVPGLDALYVSLEATADGAEPGWTVRDPAYVAGLAKGVQVSAGIVSRRNRDAGGGDPELLAQVEGAAPRPWDVMSAEVRPRHPEVDYEDVEVALRTFTAINPLRKMREDTVYRMLEAVFARRTPIFEDLRDALARTTAALVRHVRAASKANDEADARKVPPHAPGP